MTKLLALVIGALVPLAAFASPTLVATAAMTPGFVNTNYPAATGSPALNDLAVLELACNDNTSSAQPTISTPSGWTRYTLANQANAGQFAEHAVFYKIASGSEGASVNVPISNAANFNCGGQYYKLTGYSASTPIDCADIAWASNSTLDPPSRSVTGGPLDVFVTAFATSRGDESYVSGSDLTTNTHANVTVDLGGGLANSGRTVAESHGAYTAISSKDPGAFVIGSNSRAGSAITCVIYPNVGVSKPLCGPLCGPLQGPVP